LRCRIQKPTIFLKRNLEDKHTNAFGRFVGKLWQANIDAQFMLHPYATSYYTSYLTKRYRNVTQKLHNMLENCKVGKTKSFSTHSIKGITRNLDFFYEEFWSKKPPIWFFCPHVQLDQNAILDKST
jgi:hypothetical protein